MTTVMKKRCSHFRLTIKKNKNEKTQEKNKLV